MSTGFTISQIGNYNVDLDDVLVRRELFNDGNLWVCGRNDGGQLGTNNTSSYSSPVTTVAGGVGWKQVSCGGSTAAIKTDGTLWVWGNNGNGQLGTNNTSSYSSPVTTAAGGTTWKSVSSGGYYLKFCMAAIKTDGTLWVWGDNYGGQLGTNNTSSYSSPVTTVAGGTNWKTVSCGYGFTSAIKTDGTLWTWGKNSAGQLGTNNTISYSSPVQTVAGGTNWKTVSCGGGSTAAIKTDGTLWNWGFNAYGQLGTNDTSSRLSPVTTVAGGTNWKSVSTGLHYTAAIKTDGTLWVWGFNNSGQLGTNNVTQYSSPVTTAGGGTNWKSVDCGASQSTAAIKTDGTLWVWGENLYGELGTNNTSSYSSPVTTAGGGTNWKQVSPGKARILAAITDLTI